MQMTRAFEYRIYPTKEQQVLIAKTFGCCRFIYNTMLADKITHYELTNSTLWNTPAQYKSKFPWLKEVDSSALAKVQLDIQSAFKKFFREPNIGFPKFKSKKHERRSFTSSTTNNNIKLLDNNHLQLPKLGAVKIKLHRALPVNAKIKSVTVKQDADDKYFVSILCQYEVQDIELQLIRSTIGLDYSSPNLYVDSNNKSPDITRWTRYYADKLAKEQRRLSHCKFCSANYYKQLKKVNKVHAKIKRCRKDQLNKLSKYLADNYSLVVIEDLNMRNMSQMLKLGKSTMDNGFGLFRTMLEYKLRDRGKHLVKIDKFYASTKICNDCGAKNTQITLKDRVWVCPVCGVVHERDLNAAKNILDEGLRIMKGRNYLDSLFMLGTLASSSRKVPTF